MRSLLILMMFGLLVGKYFSCLRNDLLSSLIYTVYCVYFTLFQIQGGIIKFRLYIDEQSSVTTENMTVKLCNESS
jgi:hypothetical protein